MPLVSLLGFLQSESIRLTRADCFEDTQEGLFGSEEMLSHMPEHMHERITVALKEQTAETFITCWHYAALESLAMWKIYGGGKDAVAKVTTTGKVISACDQFCKNNRVTGMFGHVVYENHISKDGGMETETLGLPFGLSKEYMSSSSLVYFMKAPAFSHEKEWRIVIRKEKTDETGLVVPVGIAAEFIDSIYVAPDADDWIVAIIKTLVNEQLGLCDITVAKSSLSKHY